MSSQFPTQRIERRDTGATLGNHERRIAKLERSPVGGGTGCSDWYYVGTADQVSGDMDPYGTLISDLIAGNPGGAIIPFENGWNNSLGDDAPVSFMLDGCMVALRGAASGGLASTVIYTLPTGFRPFYQQELVVPGSSESDWASVLVLADGSVIFEQEN